MAVATKKSANLFFERGATFVVEDSDSETLESGPLEFTLLLSLIPGLGEMNNQSFAR